jgi:BON domain-containing protein
MTFPAWAYPIDRYYYGWYGLPMLDLEPTDADIKTVVVDRLRDNPSTVDSDIRVDVKQGVVILGGEVDSALAKRVAGDDAWDIPGVVDVSNQLRPRQNRPSESVTDGGATAVT